MYTHMAFCTWPFAFSCNRADILFLFQNKQKPLPLPPAPPVTAQTAEALSGRGEFR